MLTKPDRAKPEALEAVEKPQLTRYIPKGLRPIALGW